MVSESGGEDEGITGDSGRMKRELNILDIKLKEFSNERKEIRKNNLVWRIVIIYEILLIMIIVL